VETSDGGGALPIPVQTPPGISVTLTLSTSMPHPEQPLRLELRVRNRGPRPVTYWRTGQEFDLWVDGPAGRVWRWSHGLAHRDPPSEAFQAYLAQARLLPGQQHTRSAVWDQRPCADPATRQRRGRYVARGVWLATDEGGGSQGWWSDPVEFEIQTP
jgi:Intracellular proteinase inhibitor